MTVTIQLFDPGTFAGTWALCGTLLGVAVGILFAGRSYIQDGDIFTFPFFALVGAIVGCLGSLIILVYAMYLPLTGLVTIITVPYVLYLRRMRRRVLFMQSLKGEKK